MNCTCRNHQNKTDVILSRARCGHCVDQEINTLKEKLKLAEEVVGWARANPLPHPDTARLEWVIENEEQIFKSSKGWVALRSDKNMDRFCKTPREAIDAAMKEGK